ncbi:acyl-CoA dehydrogenase [Brevibacterium sp. 5221]|uniref:Acyl-CoA dehydrogenase n=1 Tax=Brevibacterium rongguiense TaxID=2695267 RepID=A0A6N9H4B9_9MICO|nr:acyl-CoA dehydrogenase family protein [Brevibacterium rongguiense]MYM18773.1 acyl-CoA dehydrogenase [Brevibacterium rongguiense]
MDLELNDVQRELGSTVRRLLRTKYNAEARDALLASEQGFSRDMWNQYAELGLLSLPFAEEYDGAGMGFAEVAVVMEEFGKALVLEPYLSTVVLGGGLVAAAGSDAQKKDILPGIVSGERLLAFAGYEPAGRYELSAPATKAAESGEGATITGEKTAVLGAPDADLFVVSAATDSGVGLFLVEAGAGGVTVSPRVQADGLRTGSVLFDGAQAQRLGSGDATAAIQAVIDTANAALAAEAVGAMEASLMMTADYLKTREQFGAPIGRNQALQHRAADAYATLEGAKSMALYAKLAITGAEGDGAASEAGKDRHRDILAAKLVIDQAAHEISQESIQLHGGIGMTMEYPIGHYAKRLTVIPRTFDDQDGVTQELAALGGLIEPSAMDV